MFSIRDSAEPEDSFTEEQDLFPPSPPPPLPGATPIIFDLPSTTTEPSSTNLTTQQQKHTPARQTPLRASMEQTPARQASMESKRRKTHASLSAQDDMWEFPTVSPAKTRRSKTMLEADDMGKKYKKGNDSVTKGKRRNSISEIESSVTKSTRTNSRMGDDRGRRHEKSTAEESPVVTKARKRLSRCIEDSDVEEQENGAVDEDGPAQTDTQQTEIILDEEEPRDMIIINSSPIKRLTRVIVEIPSKKSVRKSRRTTLQEIPLPLENTSIITPETSPQKPFTNPPPGRSPSPQPEDEDPYPPPSQELENIVLAAVPQTPKTTKTEDKAPVTVQGVGLSPTKSTGIAKILGKSPNRPIYRVGLSRRVNVEPLHGYLKRSA